MRKALSTVALAILALSAIAQQTFPQNGVYDERDKCYAFTNATIFVSWNQKLEKATLLIRDGKVESVGASVVLPKDAVVLDLKGKFIYPSFIDLYSSYGMPEMRTEGQQGRNFNQPQQTVTSKDGAYMWNEALKPEFRAYEVFKATDAAAKGYRNSGFGAVLSHRMDGISRGTSTLVTLANEKEHLTIVKEQVAHHLSFSKGSSRQNYPGSLMGGIALLRQTYLDGQWHAAQKAETNISLSAWNAVQSLPQIFEVGNKLEALRAAALGKEFGITYLFKGDGDEYQRLAELKATGSTFILPLDFPEAYDVEDPFDAQLVNLSQMKHWELAPYNPAKIAEAGIPFVLTSHGLKKAEEFLPNLRKAVENGLAKDAALKALTATPASIAGASDKLGSLEKGKIANFIIASNDIFEKETKIHHNWVNGKPYILKDLDAPELTGNYNLVVDNIPYQLAAKGEGEKVEMTIVVNDSTNVKVKHQVSNGLITLSFTPKGEKNAIRLSGTVSGRTWSGKGQNGAGQWIDWNASYTGPAAAKEEKKDDRKPREKSEPGALTYPFVAYGWEKKPQPATYLIRNATVWTNEKDGILQGADVLVQNGKIAQVGKGLKATGAVEIDGTGKHLTPGILDEHSHVAVSRGVNEGTQASSAEVRIGDVINSEDINIYRLLSGGVTAAQLLHGSANPIGGQSALIKMRWGYAPDAMKFEGADGFIKFALGENVKQSGANEATATRFPQTRMGVEQFYEDYFTRAKEYGAVKRSGKPYRRDLDLETGLEILEKKRFITCHSYVQSEINMLMKVAERFGFKINTFTHILEGYKVADIMAKHGVGGSSFSDWWAYKYEVYEAIPYNGALMHEQGVLVAFNSDDAEMARRLNQEAGKAVLFGGVPEEEALKFVTLNPAKLLHVDHRVGSIKVGKDADIVLWSDHPLSVYAKAEQTFVDGIKFFDRKEDEQLRAAVSAERSRLVQKMIAAKQGGGPTQAARGASQSKEYHCDDVHDEMED